MRPLLRTAQIALVLVGLMMGAAPAAAQLGGGLRGTAVGLTYDVPAGDFAKRVSGASGVRNSEAPAPARIATIATAAISLFWCLIIGQGS